MPFTFLFSSTNLNAGSADLTIENIAITPPWPEYSFDYTRFICISFTVEYPRLYRAQNDALRCTGGTEDIIAVTGFTSDDILVLDVTDPSAPCVIQPSTVTKDATTSTWTVAFSDAGSERVYRVCSLTDGVLVPAVRGVRDIDWSQASSASQYAILIPPEAWRDDFRAVMQPLADFRNAQGLRTTIIDVESLYNAFSDGLVDPFAIQQFCAAAHSHGLAYLLLVGSGSLDYKHLSLSVNDFPACLIPTLIAGQSFTTGEGVTVALDAMLGDVDGDYLPDVAVGRLPTSRTNELARAVAKTITYEGALTWKRQVSVAAQLDSKDNFIADANTIMALLVGSGRSVLTHYGDYGNNDTPSGLGFNYVRDGFFDALNSGSGLFYFFGHTSHLSLGNGTRLLHRSYDFVPAKWSKPPIAIVMGCIPNRWQATAPSILPHGLFADGTGFVAGLGSSGYMLVDEGKELAEALLTETGESRLLRLGDVMLRGLRHVAAKRPFGEERQQLMCFSLVGDPALVYRHDVTSTGTDVTWLVERGLIAPNDDLADLDQDGWPTWQEYFSGTDPRGHLLRITDAHITSESVRTISFESSSNTQYQVQWRPLLGRGEWQLVSWGLTNVPGWNAIGIPVPPQGPVTTVSVPATNNLSSGFYRIRSGGNAE